MTFGVFKSIKKTPIFGLQKRRPRPPVRPTSTTSLSNPPASPHLVPNRLKHKGMHMQAQTFFLYSTYQLLSMQSAERLHIRRLAAVYSHLAGLFSSFRGTALDGQELPPWEAFPRKLLLVGGPPWVGGPPCVPHWSLLAGGSIVFHFKKMYPMQ